MHETDILSQQRIKKLDELRKEGINPYPNNFRVDTTTKQIREAFGKMTKEEIERVEDRYVLAGRIMSIRNFGKAAFFHLQDRSGKLQAFIQKKSGNDFCL